MIILHILLWILLGLLGLLLLILINPVQYAFQWERKSFDAPHWLRIHFRIFLGLLRFQIVLENSEPRTSFAIFGIESSLKEKEQKPKKEKKKKEKEAKKSKKKPKKVVKKVKWVRKYFSIADFKQIAKRTIHHLWGWLKPSHLSGNFQVGTGNPAYTGILFGWYCSTRLFENALIKITPEFVHSGLCGNGAIRGRLILIDLVRRILLIGITIISIYIQKKFQLIFYKPTTHYTYRTEGGTDV